MPTPTAAISTTPNTAMIPNNSRGHASSTKTTMTEMMAAPGEKLELSMRESQIKERRTCGGTGGRMRLSLEGFESNFRVFGNATRFGKIRPYSAGRRELETQTANQAGRAST